MDIRSRGLGRLAVLPDELIDVLLRRLDARTLTALGTTSKVMQIFCVEEPLWLELQLSRRLQAFRYQGSWRATYLACNPGCNMPGLTASKLLPTPRVEGFSSMFLYRRWYRGHVELSTFVPPSQSIQQIDGSSLTAEQFEERYDLQGEPVLLQGLTRDWKTDAFALTELSVHHGARLFTATKPSGGRIPMQLDHYLEYCAVQRDEEPLYIFDADFGGVAPQLLAAYRVPHLFRWDLLGDVGHVRDDYRWLVVGPPRSGASWHVDPAATSAWNTSLQGRKRWALYPPGRVPPGVLLNVDSMGDPDFRSPTSLQWFLEVYPHLPPEDRPLEVVQEPGDTLFLPKGWWHCVLNLDTTVAVTQNFVSPANLEAVVAYLSLGAGSLFDPGLVPAYLHRRQLNTRSAPSSPAATWPASPTAPPASPAPPHSPSSSGTPSIEVDAASHLREGVLGFDRGGILGRWLRGMWCGHPALRPRIAELAERYTDVLSWQRRVEAVCRLAGLPAPSSPETLPVSGGEAVVFQAGGAILKFYNPHLHPPVLGMWQLEAAAYQAIGEAQQAQRGRSCGCGTVKASHAALPPPARPLLVGILPEESGEQDSLEDTSLSETAGSPADHVRPRPLLQGVPFLVLRASPGVTLGSCQEGLDAEGWARVGGAVGRALAELHALPLPRCSDPVHGGGQAGGHPPQDVVCTSWRSSHGVVWSSLWGRLGPEVWAAAVQGGSPAAVEGQPHQPAGHGPGGGGTSGAAACGECGRQGGSGREARLGWDATHALGPQLQLFPGVKSHAPHRPGCPRQPTARAVPRDQPDAKGSGPEDPVHMLDGGPGARPVGRDASPVSLCDGSGGRAGAAQGTDAHPGGFGHFSGCGRRSSPDAYGVGGGLGAWGPFLSFLEFRRGRVVRSCRRSAALPPHLIDQLQEYLPQDMTTVLGLPPRASAAAALAMGRMEHPEQSSAPPFPNPCWVQADLTPENILIVSHGGECTPAVVAEGGAGATTMRRHEAEEEWSGDREEWGGDGGGEGRCQAVLIDFADGGHGDPLWDLVTLHVRSFKCNQHALRACVDAYRIRLTQLRRGEPEPLNTTCLVQPRHRHPFQQGKTVIRGGDGNLGGASTGMGCHTCIPWSYVATVYTLLHEQDMAEEAVRRMPQLWEAPTLHAFQQLLWGALDKQG